MGTRRSRGTATYVLSTPRTSAGYPSKGWVAPPCTWAFLSSLGKSEFYSILIGARRSRRAGVYRTGARPPKENHRGRPERPGPDTPGENMLEWRP